MVEAKPEGVSCCLEEGTTFAMLGPKLQAEVVWFKNVVTTQGVVVALLEAEMAQSDCAVAQMGAEMPLGVAVVESAMLWFAEVIFDVLTCCAFTGA